MKKIIIGAGPAGLYTAIKLRQAGIVDLVVYDPRVGNYTRPGHLNTNVFTKAEDGLNLELWPMSKVGHIKDLERELYKEALKLEIKFEKKRFLRLHEDPKNPGIVVDNEGEEEIVESDYVFDCTGTRREVVNAVNNIDLDSPLKLTKITDLPVSNHFLAYVKINKTDWQQFEMAAIHFQYFPNGIDTLSFVQSIIKLRTMGWKEFLFPRCYGMEFGKDKICLYLHAPDNLAKNDYENWVQTVLECYTKPITFEQLPPSPKPRFLPFRTSAQVLQDVSYKGKNLPTVIALGDAQIDFDYVLAHGIKDGIKRINSLFKHMKIVGNEIHYFDSKEYMQIINPYLYEHKKKMIKAAKKIRKNFVNALETAQSKFNQALLLTDNLEEKQVISDILKEIEGRQSYIKARKCFTKCHDESNKLVITSINMDTVIGNLNRIQNDLLKAYICLPKSFINENKEIRELLLHLAKSWKKVGNTLFKKNNKLEGIDAYQKALEIYNLDDFTGKHILKELPIYSNLTIVYQQEMLYSEAIVAGNTGLSRFDFCHSEERPIMLQKIVFNLIKALCAQAQNFLESGKNKDAKMLELKAKDIMSTYASKLTTQTLTSIEKIIGELQQGFPNNIDSDLLSSYEFEKEVIIHEKNPEKNSNTLIMGDILGNIGMFGSQFLGEQTIIINIENSNKTF